MQIVNSEIDYGEIAKKANGGTEVMMRRVASLGRKALKEFQIVVSRVENDLDPSKIRVFYAHDLPGDPSSEHLKDGGHEKYHKVVCVSNWQMQRYIEYYNLPWHKCIVMQNAIDPIPLNEKKWENPKTIRLIYHTTPHRGLEILVPVFTKLCENFADLELDVYSSFNLYGWPQRDEQYEPLFKQCREHPRINYHGTKTNEEVRKALTQTHIFAYPSIWPETSCLSLMEAMSAGCVCVHSNYGALPETSANWTHMYHYNEERNEHAKIFYTVLTNAISDIKEKPTAIGTRLKTQKTYADIFYSWSPNRRTQWEALFAMLLDQVKDRGVQEKMFTYTVH